VISIMIPLEPMGQGRPRTRVMGGHAVIYDPPESRKWKEAAKAHLAVAMNGAAPLAGPLRCYIQAVFSCPRSDWRKLNPRPRRWHTSTPDAENIEKIIWDSANKIVWNDDSQVARHSCDKVIGAQGEKPYVLVEVEEL
jgi:Holliday junction resolvase RusA-like endonuclease